ncbi:unnamed protein product [Pleuronectes platessa]|uniref:Uncharacterized protein n=1 Tax=Pleuronectes platessa TaxID=8262 RepID=A0A9N7TPB7_PLEPL|nr:unnamed protein product [Pleuronectes platessa]
MSLKDGGRATKHFSFFIPTLAPSVDLSVTVSVASRQEDYYWLDTSAGSTGLHYYAAGDAGLTKRKLSSVSLSGRAESGSDSRRIRWTLKCTDSLSSTSKPRRRSERV